MAMGSYEIGAAVRLPLQVTEGGIAETGSISPRVKSIILPDKTSESGFPANMIALNQDYGTYYYDYSPSKAGDYVVIMIYIVDSQEYTTLENFTVSGIKTIPRAEAR